MDRRVIYGRPPSLPSFRSTTMSLFGPNAQRRTYNSTLSASPSIASLITPSSSSSNNDPFSNRFSSQSSLVSYKNLLTQTACRAYFAFQSPIDSPYGSLNSNRHNSVSTLSEKVRLHLFLQGRADADSTQYSLSPDPRAWGSELLPDQPEPDDTLHNPDPRRDHKCDSGFAGFFSPRGLANLGCLSFLCVGIVTLLCVSLSWKPFVYLK